MWVPVNPGGGLTPEREGWAPGNAQFVRPVSRGGRPHFPEINTRKGNAHLVRQGGEPRGVDPISTYMGHPHVRQPSEMTGPGGPRSPGGPSDPEGRVIHYEELPCGVHGLASLKPCL